MRSTAFHALLVALALISFLTGCQCRERGPRENKVLRNQQQAIADELAAVEPGMPVVRPSAAHVEDPFSREKRMEDLRSYHAKKSWSYVIAEAVALINKGVDEDTQLELWLMLSEAYGELGDREHRDEAQSRFKELYQKLMSSERLRKEAAARQKLLDLMERYRSRRNKAAFDWPDGQKRESDKLWEKVAAAATDEVLAETLADGTEVLVSKDPEKLLGRVKGPGGEEAAIQKEPEHGYYYAIRERR